MFKKAFTLAEVLITLAIIGVVAALTIPSVVANTQQQEFKTGLKKAVSVLNSAITMNMAIDGETPYENKNLYDYLQRHMSVMRSTQYMFGTNGRTGQEMGNKAFYTTDGMRFEVWAWDNLSDTDNEDVSKRLGMPLYENNNVYPKSVPVNGCGSYGLASNVDNTTKPPCRMTVDVNGDRKPSPTNVNCYAHECAATNVYKFPDPKGKKLTDIFSIIITDKQAVPYGVAAQKAMYEAQK